MKQYNLFIVFILCLGSLYLSGQVGIKTKKPQGLFHIDGLGNNPVDMLPSVEQSFDDIVMGVDDGGQAYVGIGKSSVINGAQLELGGENRAFIPPVVALLDALSTSEVAYPTDGVIIYNKATSGTYPNNVIPGLYIFSRGKWKLLLTESESLPLQERVLQEDVTTTPCTSSDYNCAVELNMGDPIIINSDGAYAFTFRLFGPTDNGTDYPQRDIVYFWLMANGNPVDIVELNPVSFPYNGTTSYSVTLGGQFTENDVVSFRISTYLNSPKWTLTKNRNSMFYWKIENFHEN